MENIRRYIKLFVQNYIFLSFAPDKHYPDIIMTL